MTSMQQNIIYQGNSLISVETLPEYSQPVVIKKPLKRLSMAKETTRYPHICSRPNLPRRFINIGGNTLHLHRKLRLIAYVLVFLHASFAVFFLNADSAHAQNTAQVSESAQEQEKPQISLTPAERAWLAQNHTVRVRAADYEPYLIIREGEPKGISIDYIRLISERAGINIEIIKETRSFGEAFESFKELNGPDWLPHLTPTIEREPYANWSSKSYTSSPRVIFTKKNREFILDTDDLASKTIAGSRGNIVVKMLKDKYPHIRFTLFDTVGEALEAVASGKADATITNLTLGTYLINKRGLTNLKIAGPSPLGNQFFHFANRKDWPELTGIINKALDTFSAEERSAIQGRYLSPVKYEYGITSADVL
jgi:ABC-type amino acid transport substrate-binding protein